MIGIIASVRVNLTIVASASVLLLWITSQAAEVAVTDEVSLTAVPEKMAKPWLLSPNHSPRLGKTSAAIRLKKKITEIEVATSSSLASITGAVAAMADPRR